jgi:hypothetical protein
MSATNRSTIKSGPAPTVDIALAMLQNPPPCEEYNCALARECASGMACKAFGHYVYTGRAMHPSYRRTKGGLAVMGADPQPTREILAAILRDEFHG